VCLRGCGDIEVETVELFEYMLSIFCKFRGYPMETQRPLFEKYCGSNKRHRVCTRLIVTPREVLMYMKAEKRLGIYEATTLKGTLA
jgi:hypothetical protein